MDEKRPFYIDTDYGIIHEDGDLLVVDKPAPLPVHSVGSYGALNLLDLLRKEPAREGQELRTPHRLDSETSGVLLLAKTQTAARSLGVQFTAGEVRKKYRAIVFGRPPADRGEIREPLGKDPDSSFVVRVRDPDGEAAHTQYEVLASTGDYSLVELTPLTGRTHQLRIHLSLLGSPIVGDKIYVNADYFLRYVNGGLDDGMIATLKLPRLALHATEIAFIHPGTGEAVSYHSPVAVLLKDFAESAGLDIPGRTG